MRKSISIGRITTIAGLSAVAVRGDGGDDTRGCLRRLSGGQLWYERNAIFARYGYCFKTEQALRTFGPRCHPPYGRLPPHAQDRVNEIMAWERRKGCN